jgi:AcrR family transcriptional regulator
MGCGHFDNVILLCQETGVLMSDDTQKQGEKRQAVFDAAADVFATYGFRRTSMNDIASAAGISRPALYLMFQNKDDLFRQMAVSRQAEAIEAALSELSAAGPIAERVARAILAYERRYYEPVAQSPHGAELMDANLSIAGDEMRKGSKRFAAQLAKAIENADAHGEVALDRAAMSASAFVELMMASVNGQKKAANSNADFRKKIANVVAIFLASIESGGKR